MLLLLKMSLVGGMTANTRRKSGVVVNPEDTKVNPGSHAALSHLQFQDVAAQRVLHVDNWLHDVEIELRDGDATDVTPPVHVEEGGGHVDDSLAGVVQLF